jgi:hypothetical protein
MKPRHKIPTPKQAGLASQVSFLQKLKNTFSKEHQHSHGSGTESQYSLEQKKNLSGPSVHTIAMVLDGEVYDILRAQDSLADIFLAQPTFVLVDDTTATAKIGSRYIDGKFIDNEPTT